MSNILHRQAQSTRGHVLEYLSGNLRRLRRERGFTQGGLAVASGLSRRMIAAVEGGASNLSLSNLDKLAAALSVKFTDLVRPPGESTARRIESLAWRGTRTGSEAILLGAAPAARETELWIWSLAPGERYPSEADSNNWHEMLFVLDGTLTLALHDLIRIIPSGDFYIFSSGEPYVFLNRGASALRFIRNVVL